MWGMEMVQRQTDTESMRFERRGERLFRKGFDWFYHMRGGQRGPFPSKAAAQEDLAEYLRSIRFIEENPDSVPDDLDAAEITHIDIKPPQY